MFAVLATGQWWAVPLWTRGRLLYYQHRCMAYEPLPQQVAGTWVGSAETGSVNGTVPTEWSTFYRLYSPPGMWSSATLFLHERSTPSGRRRLVAVDLTSDGTYFGISWTAEARVFAPGGLTTRPRELPARHDGPTWLLPAAPPQFMAGVADPADPSHFTFAVVEGGPTAHYDGWLRDDDTVRIERRPKP